MNIKTKIGAGLAAVAMIGSVIAPSAFADNTIQISGNGNGSDNTVSVQTSSGSSVDQYNESHVGTGIFVSQNTGDNSVSGNTGNGSDNSIDTGNATTDVTIKVSGNKNTYNGDECGCQDPEVNSVTVKNNGNGSTNTVRINKRNRKSFVQTNVLSTHSFIGVEQNTGDNSVKNNTGKWSWNTIKTGRTRTTIGITVGGSTNTN